jgi:eukaryotic-like serine/threonine-protein kinase
MSTDPNLQAPASGASDPAATVLRSDPMAASGIQPGTLLVNTYRVERLLGGGGMGEVYLARHAGLGTEHAIKVIRPSMLRNAQVMDLFYREAKVLRGVRHDAVVSYDGFVRDDQGRDYLVMEYVEGPSLSDLLKRGPLPPSDVLTLRDRLCAGLAEAHRRGAVHRDLSPDNVVLPGERIAAAKLIDFGLCKLTDPGQETIVGSSFAGKYRYASPEQFGLYGGSVDARSDIYSLGLILAAAAQGRPLSMGESFADALQSRQQIPDLSQVPPILREWLSAMLEPDPAARPESIDALLERWPAATVLGGKAPPTKGSIEKQTKAKAVPSQPVARSQAKPAGSGARVLLLVGVVAIVLSALGAGLWWVLRPIPSPLHKDGGQIAKDFGKTGAKTDKVSEPPVQESPSDQSGTSGEGGPARSSTDKPPVDKPPTRDSGGPPADDLAGLTAAGRLDDAFALVQSRMKAGQAPPPAEVWALIERLQAAGKSDNAFALIKILAANGDGPAAFAFAEQYDPLHWSAESSGLSKPNPEKAREWYQRAADLGVSDATARLQALAAQEGGQ